MHIFNRGHAGKISVNESIWQNFKYTFVSFLTGCTYLDMFSLLACLHFSELKTDDLSWPLGMHISALPVCLSTLVSHRYVTFRAFKGSWVINTWWQLLDASGGKKTHLSNMSSKNANMLNNFNNLMKNRCIHALNVDWNHGQVGFVLFLWGQLNACTVLVRRRWMRRPRGSF